MKSNSFVRAGEWVRVRSREEILSTLDARGQLDGLPFMPEMFRFCGTRMRVFRRAHKTCDPPNGMGGRRMIAAVHLEGARCDGQAHGGCQANCLLFWKDAWLEAVDTNDAHEGGAIEASASAPGGGDTGAEWCVWDGTRHATEPGESGEPRYICQSTQLAVATTPLRWWDLRQYWEDYTSGNVSLSRMITTSLLALYYQLAIAGLGLGSFLRWTYDRYKKFAGGTPYPWREGKVRPGTKTPSAKLDVQPGEWVKIRSYEDILGTLDQHGLNRGMSFDAEMVPYCGGTYRVLDRVQRIINEKTGKMQHLKNECLILEDVFCKACYARSRRFCPRSIFPYWREIWLEPLRSGSKRA
jgi:hypothetical protein